MAEPLGAGVEEPVDRDGAFPRLDAERRAALREAGELLTVASGDVLFREGDASYDFFVVESGAVTIVRGYGAENRVIAVHGPHRFLGELNLLAGGSAFLTAVVRDAGQVIRVPVARLRDLVMADEGFANMLLRAYLARRAILIAVGGGVKVVGSRHSRDARRLREFLARNRVPHEWIELELDEEAEATLRALGVGPGETPVLIDGATVLRNPSNGEASALLGLGARGAPPAMCDLVIVGCGPAGLAAAVYGASEGLDTQAIDAFAFGGQAGTSTRIENYLGFPAGVSGAELTERALLQARRFGARLVVPARASALHRQDGHFTIALEDGGVVAGRAVIIATGANYRRLDVPELDRFEGAGVYYAATMVEGQLCESSPVAVVGGGNSAGQAAMFLSRTCSTVRIVIRGETLEHSMSRYLIDEIAARANIEIVPRTEIVALHGGDWLEAVTARSRDGGERRIDARALFTFIGASPCTDWLEGVAADEHGFLLTGRDVQGADGALYEGDRPYFLETSVPGLFAVGDVHSGSIKRCASAVGEGSMAVARVHQRLAAG
jgi:thioredoxin reductase (NADPH)